MIYQLLITDTFENDLLEIHNYISIELSNTESANEQVEHLVKVANTLTTFPKRYPVISIDNVNYLELRKIPVGNYLIFYCINKDVVEILRVTYAKYNWEKLFRIL